MSFPKYKKYKDSGVEWLGEVPAHWRVVRVRWLCEIKKRIVGKLGFDVLSITQKGIRIKDTESNDGQISMDYSKYQLVEVGDFAMNHMDLLTGFVDRSSVVGVTSPDYRVFSIRDTSVSDDGFVLYLFQNGYINRVFFPFGQGSSQLGRWRLPTEQFNDFWLPVPPLAEQHAIATFLDHETAKIDALVEAQKRLIELLKEKRQAVISHAVTKGLNPNAPMKDSGVEWLGEVPAHWEVKSIRYILNAIGDVDHFMPVSVESGIPYLMTGDLQEFVSDVSLEDCKQVSRNDYLQLSKKIRTSKGDVVMARYATIGTLMYVDVDVEILISYSCVTLKTNSSKMSGIYLFQYMKSDPFRWSIEIQTNTNTQGNVGIKDLQDLKVMEPPVDEQAAIVTFLHHETAKIDRLTAEANSGIDLLQERRTALISAAVTGKIDVRSKVKPPESALA